MNRKFLIITLFTLLTSCTHATKQKLGIVQTVPDEYQVTSNRPLEVPPSFALPKPKEPEKKSRVKANDNVEKSDKTKKRSWWPWSRKKSNKSKEEQVKETLKDNNIKS